ncbi:hypothetical protein BDN72DRAFT_865682 [Pluteus cervinus]|uniref:Uncharacterized protein n=1 Tax=Pluteus cervinus TaxID=181527 RepID=A0ACD3A054_9AGAR|nr:hypothetical protein BDN72DRAFT_865682 [Pluteus cervinus]
MLSRILPDSISRYFAAAEQHIDPALSQEDHHSPIQSLPPELLQEIFAFSASPFPDPPPILIQEPLPAQFNSTSLYISRVCNQWRSLSFATSEMWSWMSISCPNDLCVKHVKYYLRRAGKVQGLHLSLAEPSSSSWTPPAPAENKWTLAIFRLWIPEAHRWRSIRFDFRNTPPIPEIINLSPGSLNKVTSFSLRTEWPDSVVEQFWDKVHTSPALREVEWRFPLTPNSAPLVQLTSIDMPGHILSCTEFLALLSSCNKLRQIEVIVDPVTEAEARSITCVTLAGCLEMLLLHFGPGEVEFGLLLDYIKAPNLRELEVEVSRSDRAVLRRFLCQSGCSLRRLWLRTNNFTYSEDHLLDSLLDAAPYLTSVEGFLEICLCPGLDPVPFLKCS